MSTAELTCPVLAPVYRRPQVFRSLVIVPLVDSVAVDTGWLTLDQAIEREPWPK